MLYNVSFFNPIAQEETVMLVEAMNSAEAKVIGWAVGNPYDDILSFPFCPDEISAHKYSTKPEATYETAVKLIGKKAFNDALKKSLGVRK